MKDPVTLSTGVTYDRESIHSWIFSYNRNTCPVTKQPLTHQTLTPNTTLLRLIQSWQLQNSSNHARLVSLSASKRVLDLSLIGKLVAECRKNAAGSQLSSLHKMKSLIQDDDYNRRCMEEAGVASVMASLITDQTASDHPFSDLTDDVAAVEEAIHLLYLLKPSAESLKKLAERKNGKLIASLSSVMHQGSYRARTHATLLLDMILKAVGEIYKADLQPELFHSLVEIVKDQNVSQATKAALSILLEVAPFGSNGAKAIRAGMMEVVVELLVETDERRSCESMLGLLEVFFGMGDGRAAFLGHPMGLAAVSSKILKVSQVANERAVKVLWMVCKFCERDVVQEMVEIGGVAKLCMVVQSECSVKAKERAKDVLGWHFKSWRKSRCFPSNMRL
ncbi:hypothetical protein ACLOJK_005030 [Asimina triloba]